MKLDHYDQTLADFQRDTANHVLTVLHDDGVYRHLRFGTPGGSSVYCFHLITYPGGLLYRGDMGSFAFERTHDMLQFFRRPDNEKRYRIDLRYWAEKVTASERGGTREHDPDGFAAEIRRLRREWVRENWHTTTREQRRDLWDSISDQVLAYADDKHRGPVAAYDFTWRDDDVRFQFNDLFDSDHAFKRYTRSFMWCCFALVWAIGVYDAAKQPAEMATT
jgi:hypothetical protein